MKKGLIGLLIVSFVLVFTVSAMAEIKLKWNGQAKIELDSRDYQADGAPYFGVGSTFLQCKATQSFGPWEGIAIATSMYDKEMDEAPGLSKFGTPFAIRTKVFMVYQGEDFKLTLDPTGIAPDTLISEVQEGVFKTEVPIKIPARPGIMLEIPISKGFAPYLIYNNVKSGDEVWTNYVVASMFKTGNFSLDARYAVGGEKDANSYGTSIGGYAKYKKSPIELKLHMMSWNPKAGNVAFPETGTAMYARFKYSMPKGMILDAFYFEYYHRDKEVYDASGAYNVYKFKGYIPLGKNVVLGPYVYVYDNENKDGKSNTRIKFNLTMTF